MFATVLPLLLTEVTAPFWNVLRIVGGLLHSLKFPSFRISSAMLAWCWLRPRITAYTTKQAPEILQRATKMQLLPQNVRNGRSAVRASFS